jgi:nucleotide sugar dehydrogenase
MQTDQSIGFIGQGYVGKSYADNFESREFSVVRYSLEEEYLGNRDALDHCKIIFIAVPTPTGPDGFDDSIVRSAVRQVGIGKTVVIKSTLLPGTTERIQNDFPDLTILYSPEFLSEKTAAYDVANPFSNIVGLPSETPIHRDAAENLLTILPTAKQEITCSSREAELIKYAHNTLGYTKVVFMNLLFEVAQKLDIDWAVVKQALLVDPMIAPYHLDPVHKGGRGAGGRCHIKDFEAFLRLYQEVVADDLGEKILVDLRSKNNCLLKDSQKSLDILSETYGAKIPL